MGEEIKVNTESLLAKIKNSMEWNFPLDGAEIKPETTMEELHCDDIDILGTIMDLEDLNDKSIDGAAEDFKTVQDIINAMVKAGITE